MTAIIETRGLNKQFGDIQALEDFSLSIEPGTVTGLIGPNGAGKTTLLRALLGLNKCEGDLQVLGMT